MPWEADKCTFKELWLVIEAKHEEIKEQWEMSRVTWFYIMRFGNSDPKRAPKTPQQMHRFPWDKKQSSARFHEIMKRHAIKKAQREQNLKK